eukprot:TRINITY_DN24191_c0_g1_i2.p1 TRINITY_DN24191_c0_g1~~TRINITY_DN24191_c0_g1_i2.p1  ORF type:complete len:1997 (+),score=616.93 TRINITY_DN24191_c0_g1_i2:48-6038(+)
MKLAMRGVAAAAALAAAAQPGAPHCPEGEAHYTLRWLQREPAARAAVMLGGAVSPCGAVALAPDCSEVPPDEARRLERYEAAALSGALLRGALPPSPAPDGVPAAELGPVPGPVAVCYHPGECCGAASGEWAGLRRSGSSRARGADMLTHVWQENPAIIGNHNPTFTLRKVDVVVAEDSGPYMDGQAYAYNIDDQNPNQEQNILFEVTNDNEKLFSVQPHIIGCSVQKCRSTVGNVLTEGTLGFTPAPNAYGRALVKVVAVDDGYPNPVCDGFPNVTVCTPASPNYVPCDPVPCTHSNPQYFWIEILPVNDPPEFTHKGDVTSGEDEPACHDDWITGVTAGGLDEDFMQADGQSLSWEVTTTDTHMFSTQPFIVYNQGETNAQLCYSPAPNKVGQAVITVTLTDSGHPPLSAPPVQVTITITEINDLPSFSTRFSGPREEVEAGQRVGHFIMRYDDPVQAALFTAEGRPAVSRETGVFSFTPAPNANTFKQPVLVHIKLEDEVDPPLSSKQTPEVTVQIVIDPVNDPPSFEPPLNNVPVEVWEDAAPTPLPWATQICIGGVQPNCVDSEGDPAGEAQRVVFDAAWVSGPPELFAAQADRPAVREDGYVLLYPAKDKTGNVTLRVTQTDTGPPPNVGPAHLLWVSVLPVNDPPRFRQSAAPVAAAEDDPGVRVRGFLTEVASGPGEPDEWWQTVTCTVTVNRPELFHPLGGLPRVELTAGGTAADLLFRPAPDRVGTAEALATCSDDGGTERGGEDTATGRPFTIVIDPVSDPPSFRVAKSPIVVEEDEHPTGHIIPGVLDNITAGPFGEDAREAVAFVVSANPPFLFSVPPRISPRGTLAFTLAPDANGNARLTVVAYDSVTSANRSEPPRLLRPSNASAIELRVLPENDAPRVTLAAAALPGGAARLAACIAGEDAPAGGTCTRTAPGILSDAVVGPPDEEAWQVLNLSIAVPEAARGFVAEAPPPRFGGTPRRTWARPEAHAPGPDLIVTLAAFPRGTTLPPLFYLQLRAADSGPGPSNFSVTGIPVRIVEAPPPGGGPSRLRVVLEPRELPGGVVGPIELALEDDYGRAAPDTAAVRVDIVSTDLGLRWPHGAVEALPGSPRSRFTVWNTTARSPGSYRLEALATLSSGQQLRARSASFSISAAAVSGSAARTPGGALPAGGLAAGPSEDDLRRGSWEVLIPAPSGARWADHSAGPALCMALDGAPLPTHAPGAAPPAAPSPTALALGTLAPTAAAAQPGCGALQEVCAAVAVLSGRQRPQPPAAALAACGNGSGAARAPAAVCACVGAAWVALYEAEGIAAEAECAAHTDCLRRQCGGGAPRRPARALAGTLGLNCTAAVRGQGRELAVRARPAPLFNISSPGALEVSVPRAALNTSQVVLPRVVVPLRAAPSVAVTPPGLSVTAEQLRRSGANLSLDVSGAEWALDGAAAARQAFVPSNSFHLGRVAHGLQSPPEGGFASHRDELLSASRITPTRLVVRIGPAASYQPVAAERVVIDNVVLAAALTTADIPPELSPATVAVRITLAEGRPAIPSAQCDQPAWYHFAVASSIAAGLLSAGAAPAAGSMQATMLTSIAAAAQQVPPAALCPDALRAVGAATEWAVNPTGRDWELAAMLAVLICAGICILHGAVAAVVILAKKVGVQEAMALTRFPSMLLGPQLFFLCGGAYCAARSAAPVACVTVALLAAAYAALWAVTLSGLHSADPIAEELPLASSSRFLARTRWASRDEAAVRGAVERLGHVFRTLRRRRLLWSPFALLAAGLLPPVVLGAAPSGAGASVVAAVLFTAHGCGLGSCPHASPGLAVAEAAADAALVAALAALAALLATRESGAAGTGTAGRVAAGALLGAMWLHGAACAVALFASFRRAALAHPPARKESAAALSDCSGSLAGVGMRTLSSPGSTGPDDPPNPLLEFRSSAPASRQPTAASSDRLAVSTRSAVRPRSPHRGGRAPSAAPSELTVRSLRLPLQRAAPAASSEASRSAAGCES